MRMKAFVFGEVEINSKQNCLTQGIRLFAIKEAFPIFYGAFLTKSHYCQVDKGIQGAI